MSTGRGGLEPCAGNALHLGCPWGSVAAPQGWGVLPRAGGVSETLDLGSQNQTVLGWRGWAGRPSKERPPHRERVGVPALAEGSLGTFRPRPGPRAESQPARPHAAHLRTGLDGIAVVEALAEDGGQPPVQVLDFGLKVSVIVIKTLKANPHVDLLLGTRGWDGARPDAFSSPCTPRLAGSGVPSRLSMLTVCKKTVGAVAPHPLQGSSPPPPQGVTCHRPSPGPRPTESPGSRGSYLQSANTFTSSKTSS